MTVGSSYRTGPQGDYIEIHSLANYGRLTDPCQVIDRPQLGPDSLVATLTLPGASAQAGEATKLAHFDIITVDYGYIVIALYGGNFREIYFFSPAGQLIKSFLIELKRLVIDYCYYRDRDYILFVWGDKALIFDCGLSDKVANQVQVVLSAVVVPLQQRSHHRLIRCYNDRLAVLNWNERRIHEYLLTDLVQAKATIVASRPDSCYQQDHSHREINLPGQLVYFDNHHGTMRWWDPTGYRRDGRGGQTRPDSLINLFDLPKYQYRTISSFLVDRTGHLVILYD